jgi:diguanylate cyclase (GGDEF)-like protein
MNTEDQLSAFLGWLERQPKVSVTATGILLVLVVGWIDYLTGFEISLSFFYLIPIVLVTWFHGKKAGVWLAVLCAGVWWGASLLTGTYSSTFVLLWNVGVRFAIFLLVTILMGRLHSHLEIESRLARTDYLTGAVNSRAFYEIMEAELQRARRYRRPFAVGYLDMDNFKEINDAHGHSAGDALLKMVSETIRGNVRTVDVLARLGGDEFAILLPETGRDAEAILSRLHSLLTKELSQILDGPTMSLGVIAFLSSPTDVDRAIHLVDDAMYRIKKNGKNAMLFEIYEEPVKG